ncbi:DNA-directed RNA polymerase [Kockiozyma suomiensis]|uniref:DNA-directed RNA polymerase n=1 Tax=Kockiozyma suomiensis TaxID=1337062 RepID=UPI0033436EB5
MPSKKQEVEVSEAVEIADQEMVDTEALEEEIPVIDSNKIQILPGASEDGTAASFRILQEDHTLGNALRYIIMKNPEVEFCGYSIPHPSEAAMNLRIQTYGEITAVQALEKGLDDLVDLCNVIESEFKEAISKKDYETSQPIDN